MTQQEIQESINDMKMKLIAHDKRRAENNWNNIQLNESDAKTLYLLLESITSWFGDNARLHKIKDVRLKVQDKLIENAGWDVNKINRV